MAEKDSKPTRAKPENRKVTPAKAPASRRFLPLALGLVALLVGCIWWSSRPEEPIEQTLLSTPAPTESVQNNRPAQSAAALTRVASSLAQNDPDLPTVTPTPANVASSQVPLPTVTPTLVPSPVATRTIELSGEATLRLDLNSENFESSGQPVTIPIAPRNLVLGGDTMSQHDEWCMQLGPTGLVFDLTFTLRHVTEDLHVGGELQLYDGFCGEWGKLGNRLSTVPMDVTVPAGATALLAPTLQVQGSFLGLPNLLNISTGIYLDLTVRNPRPR